MEMDYDYVLRVMKDKFGFSGFLPDQENCVKAVLDGNLDVIVSMATNSGKSLCFQLPAALQQNGIVLVITPNLSLMEGQKHYLNKLGLRAISIDSTDQSKINRREIRNMLVDPKTNVKFFYLTPEMASQTFYIDFLNTKLDDGIFSHVVVDEAHCLIDKNYRTAFSVLKTFRQRHPNVPFIALTTGSTDTLKGIQELLGMNQPTIVQCTSVKTNICYEAFCIDDETPVTGIDFLETIKKLAPYYQTLKPKELPSGIIYCKTITDINDVVAALKELKIPATSFHGSLDHKERFSNYDAWFSDKIPVMVATTESFGLGIVKPRVKFVIHTSVPKNLRAFYQESGRAGAAGDTAIHRVYYKSKQLNNNPEMSHFLLSGECYHKQMGIFFGENIDDCTDRCSSCLYKNQKVDIKMK